MWLMLGAAALAQPPTDTRPSFSLASGSAGSSNERPAVFLTFRQLDHLDFRIYRVDDPAAFMAGLDDLHQLGSEEPLVEQVPTLLERIAVWKAARRDEIRTVLRRQFTRHRAAPPAPRHAAGGPPADAACEHLRPGAAAQSLPARHLVA